MKEIITDRLIIKYGEIEDYVKVHEYDFNYLEGIDGIFEYVKNDQDSIRSWFSMDSSIEEHHKRHEKSRTYDYIIFLKNTMEPIGNIGFDRYNKDLNSLEISCYIHPKYWGKGYVVEALIGAMKYIYDLGYDNILYGYYEGNSKSKKVQEKLGFVPFRKYKVTTFLGSTCINYENIICINYENIMSKERFYELYGNKFIKK